MRLFSIFAALLITLTCGCQRISFGVITDQSISVTSDWVSISMPKPVTAKWDVQAIYLDVISKHESSIDPMGTRLQDGSVVKPEIELLTETGQVQSFRFVGFSNAELVFENDHIVRGSTFSKLRIRSPKPLVCSRIKWVSYMPEDTKTGVP